MTFAARAMTERKTFVQRSYREAIYEEDQRTVRGTVVSAIGRSLSVPNIISMQLRPLYRRLSYLNGILRRFPPGKAVSHKSVVGRTSPLPRQIYFTASLTGMPSAVKPPKST